MAFERVAHFARLAASDSGVLSALQDDPESMRQPLDLSEAQVRALISASAFTSAKPVRTTSRAEDPVGDTTNLMDLGTLGTLLPPEGSGAFPAPGDLPPVLGAPVAVAPQHATPTGNGAPKGVPPSSPPVTIAPQHAAPTSPPMTPVPQSAAPAQTASPTAPPQAASPVFAPQAGTTAPQASAVPVSYGPVSATPVASPGQAYGSPQQTLSTAAGEQGTAGQVEESDGTAPIPIVTAPTLQRFTVPTASGSCGCSCDVGMIAIVAQVSSTAQAAITAITAIAGMS
jgi:hypothetical protein